MHPRSIVGGMCHLFIYCPFHWSGVRHFWEKACIFSIWLFRLSLTKLSVVKILMLLTNRYMENYRCLWSKDFPSNALLTITTSKLWPHPPDVSLISRWIGSNGDNPSLIVSLVTALLMVESCRRFVITRNELRPSNAVKKWCCKALLRNERFGCKNNAGNRAFNMDRTRGKC